jgi:histone-lysine N-methyltransferase SETMAR
MLAYFQKHGENVSSASYCEVVLKLWDAICRKRPGQLTRGILFHYENARPHTTRATQERIHDLQWGFLEYPPYSLDSAPSVFYIFAQLKTHLGDKRFAHYNDVEMEVQKWPRQQSEDFYAAAFDAMLKQWDKCISVGGGYVER